VDRDRTGRLLAHIKSALVTLIGSPVQSGGPFLFVYKTCARRPPSIVLKRMAVARGAWTAAPDPPIGGAAARAAARVWRRGARPSGCICAVFAPDSAVFAPRTGVCATGARAMFLTNNHVENTFGLR
jgi:hypothetical protein